MELELTLAHVNHGTRESAWQDECVVLRIGATFGLAVRVAALEGDRHDEAALREARYEALAQIGASRRRKRRCHRAPPRGSKRNGACLRCCAARVPTDSPECARAARWWRASIWPARCCALPPKICAGSATRTRCRTRSIPPTPMRGLRRNALRAALEALRPLFPGLDAAVARTAEVLAEEMAGTQRADLRREVRAVLAEQEGLQDVDFVHVEAAVRAIERGGSGRFHMKKGVELQIEHGVIVGTEQA